MILCFLNGQNRIKIYWLPSGRTKCSRKAEHHGFINTKMLLFHIELVLPVSFQMLPALGTLLFRGNYLTGARPSQTGLRHAIGEGVVCVWLTKQVSDGPPSHTVFKYGPCVTAVMNSHVHTVCMYMFRSVLGQIRLSICFRLFLGCWVRKEFHF